MSSLRLSQLPAITARAERCPVRGLAGIKPPERSYRRSQLSLRVLEFYEDKRLGMPRAALQPPSKPVHPRYPIGGGPVDPAAHAGVVIIPDRRRRVPTRPFRWGYGP